MGRARRGRYPPRGSAQPGTVRGIGIELAICEPHWLFAGWVTERATGTRRAFTYRSVQLRDHDELDGPRYKRLADFTEGLVPGDLSRELADSGVMVFGRAELTVYEVAA